MTMGEGGKYSGPMAAGTHFNIVRGGTEVMPCSVGGDYVGLTHEYAVLQGGDMARTITIGPYVATWPDDDPDAGFRALVAEYSRLDGLATLDVLSRTKDIPVGALVAFIVGRYSASGSDALLEFGPQVVGQMDSMVQKAESAGTDRARLEAYSSLKAIVSWLKVPLDDPDWRPAR